MKQRLVFMISMWFTVVLALALFAFTQLTSISGVDEITKNESLIHSLIVVFLAIALIVIILQVVFLFFTRFFYGQFNFMVRNNFYTKLVSIVLVLIFLTIIAASYGNKTTYTIMTWVSFAWLTYLAYLDIKLVLKFYFAF